MSCESCARAIEERLAQVPGVIKAEVSYGGSAAIVDFLPVETGRDEIKRAVKEAGYAVEAEESFQSIRTRGGRRWVQAFIEGIDLEKCNGCGRCVRACGQNVFALTTIGEAKRAAIVNGEECLGDCHCHKACPTGALVCRPRRLV